MNNFLKWLLIYVICIILQYITYSYGILFEILTKDTTYICTGILILFWIFSTYCGYNIYKKDKSKEDIGWFMADTFTALGFLGTIIGMVYALTSFESFNPNDPNSSINTITAMTSGMSIALYTTLVGLIYARLLMVQVFILSKIS